MYYEDHYHPNADDDEEQGMPDEVAHDAFEIASSVSSLDTIRKKQRKLWENTKLADKDFKIIRKMINHKLVEIEVYCTQNNQGRTIRHAITGTKCPDYLVGSNDENLFFKVKYLALKEPVIMFYDSPEQYERHMKMTISQDIKEMWVKKRATYEKNNL